MVRPIPRPAVPEGLPLVAPGVSVAAVEVGRILSVMPYPGRATAALGAASGLAWPGPGQVSRDGDAMAIWAGRDMALVIGRSVDPAEAAVTEQTDAWAVFDVSGPRGVAVLARLCPVDLRPAAFPPERTLRSLLGHVEASITRLSPEVLRLMVPRSMAATLLHDLTRAIGHAARAGGSGGQISSTATLGD